MLLRLSFSKFRYSFNFGHIWAKSEVLHFDWNLIQDPNGSMYNRYLKILIVLNIVILGDG